MSRTARTHRLTALEVKRYAESTQSAPLHDGGGLYLRKRSCTLLWTLRLSDPVTGAQQWHRLFPDDPQGGYPHKGLAEARAEARRLWSTRSRGVDPRAERRRLADAQHEAQAQARLAAERRITVRALFERWVEIDLQPRVLADGHRIGRKDGGASTRDQFERRVFPRFGDRAIEDVKRADLIELLDAVKAEGKLRTANILLSELKQMLRFALMRDLVPRNPLDTVSKRDVGGASVERDRVLIPSEISPARQAAARLGPVAAIHRGCMAPPCDGRSRRRTARCRMGRLRRVGEMLSRHRPSSRAPSSGSSISPAAPGTCRRPRTSAITPSTSARSR